MSTGCGGHTNRRGIISGARMLALAFVTTGLVASGCGDPAAAAEAEGGEVSGATESALHVDRGSRPDDESETPTPLPFEKYLVFMGTGTVKNSPDISGFIGGIHNPDGGRRFQREVMGRSDAQIAQRREMAIQFFKSRFGLDVNDPRLTFAGFEFSPDAQYRAYTISGENVPASGWRVLDGGWIVVVQDPNGIDLGGDPMWAGHHVPQLTFFSFGEYAIVKPNARHGRHRGADEHIVIEYKSSCPTTVDRMMVQFMFNCEITSKQFGAGLATGTSHHIIQNPNPETGAMDLKFQTRNVLTFPELGGEVRFPDDRQPRR